MENELQGLYGLFDSIDGEFNTGFEVYANDEAAALAFAKTAAFSRIVPEEFQLRRIAQVNLKTGEVFALPPVVIEFDENTYKKCLSLYKDKEPDKK